MGVTPPAAAISTQPKTDATPLLDVVHLGREAVAAVLHDGAVNGAQLGRKLGITGAQLVDVLRPLIANGMLQWAGYPHDADGVSTAILGVRPSMRALATSGLLPPAKVALPPSEQVGLTHKAMWFVADRGMLRGAQLANLLKISVTRLSDVVQPLIDANLLQSDGYAIGSQSLGTTILCVRPSMRGSIDAMLAKGP